MAREDSAPAWIGQAHRELARLRGESSAWSYRPVGTPGVEPTVLAALGTLTTRPAEEARPIAKSAADWLVERQQADGSLGIVTSLQEPGWPTAYAMLLFQALEGYEAPRAKGLAWLLARKGTTTPREANIGHDSTLVGWPWVANTHSWIEPTSMAMMALAGEGKQLDPRFREALRLVRDRALEKGGWNYGNTVVLGTVLVPQPAPTGSALVALALVRPAADAKEPLDADETKRIDLACSYLERVLPKIRSPLSLAWGLLGLTAWDRRPKQAGEWLAEAALKAPSWSDPAFQWSLLLLAAGERSSLDLLHVPRREAAVGRQTLPLEVQLT